MDKNKNSVIKAVSVLFEQWFNKGSKAFAFA